MATLQTYPGDPWEYKIVRAQHGELGQPAALETLVREEARAGWTLVEVYGDRWARFARPRTARRKDALLPRGIDPYRTVYAAPDNGGAAWQAIFLAVCVALTLFVIVLVAVVANWPAGP